jgi:hypothetical protein
VTPPLRRPLAGCNTPCSSLPGTPLCFCFFFLHLLKTVEMVMLMCLDVKKSMFWPLWQGQDTTITGKPSGQPLSVFFSSNSMSCNEECPSCFFKSMDRVSFSTPHHKNEFIQVSRSFPSHLQLGSITTTL